MADAKVGFDTVFPGADNWGMSRTLGFCSDSSQAANAELDVPKSMPIICVFSVMVLYSLHIHWWLALGAREIVDPLLFNDRGARVDVYESSMELGVKIVMEL